MDDMKPGEVRYIDDERFPVEPAEDISCSNCRFFLLNRKSGFGDGNCRRYPPHRKHGFPATAPGWFCGEHDE